MFYCLFFGQTLNEKIKMDFAVKVDKRNKIWYYFQNIKIFSFFSWHDYQAILFSVFRRQWNYGSSVSGHLPLMLLLMLPSFIALVSFQFRSLCLCREPWLLSLLFSPTFPSKLSSTSPMSNPRCETTGSESSSGKSQRSFAIEPLIFAPRFRGISSYLIFILCNRRMFSHCLIRHMAPQCSLNPPVSMAGEASYIFLPIDNITGEITFRADSDRNSSTPSSMSRDLKFKRAHQSVPVQPAVSLQTWSLSRWTLVMADRKRSWRSSQWAPSSGSWPNMCLSFFHNI